jgi:hypothetical protein
MLGTSQLVSQGTLDAGHHGRLRALHGRLPHVLPTELDLQEAVDARAHGYAALERRHSV